MTLTLTQSNRSPWWKDNIDNHEFLLSVIYKNPLKSGKVLTHSNIDIIELLEICSPHSIIEITFDKDYEV
jgi:hypothetical protein